MFPHVKLDWNLSRLEKRLEEVPDDAGTRLELATSSLSKAMFHEGGEVWLNRALTQARRVLQADPSSPGAMVIAGIALARLERIEPATRYLDDALRADPERADVHLGLGLLHQAAQDRHQALRELEMTCRLAPESWEAHWLLARALWDRGQEIGGQETAATTRRLVERSQYHAVRARARGPTPQVEGALHNKLGITSPHQGRLVEAPNQLQRLVDNDRYKVRAQYFLGLAFYQVGKYKNAVLYLRQHLDAAPDSPKVHARLGMCFLQLGEIAKARESCNRALAVDPTDNQARWTLGCALLEEGRVDEAIRTFKAILEDAPDHAPAFGELVRIRANARDATWLRQALRAEVTTHDRLPIAARRAGEGPHAIDANPRATTQDRIQVVLKALHEVDADATGAILGAIDLTTDEGLRFHLWESAIDGIAARRGRDLAARLSSPGTGYSGAAGREVLALASILPENLLTQGLQISEEDLRRSAVDRNGPARDVADLRTAIDRERREARSWQALLLLAIGARNSRSGRALLARWAADADADLADAARTALAILGDADAAAELRKRAKAHGAEHLVDALVNQVQQPAARFQPHAVGGDADLVCSTCGKRPSEVDHLMAPEGVAGRRDAVCDQCMSAIARDRRALKSEDPEIHCALCNRDTFETRAIYVYRSVPVCADCLDASLGLVEREEVERYLAAF
jgi:tetratricopeptide (TPR) repeat protein